MAYLKSAPCANGEQLTATEGHPFKTTERKTLPVYNIEMANAHTYFVGIDGVGVHNSKCTPWKDLKPFKGKTKTDGKKLYEKDYTHKDMGGYEKRGNHLGSADMNTGEMTKLPVPGRTIRR